MLLPMHQHRPPFPQSESRFTWRATLAHGRFLDQGAEPCAGAASSALFGRVSKLGTGVRRDGLTRQYNAVRYRTHGLARGRLVAKRGEKLLMTLCDIPLLTRCPAPFYKLCKPSKASGPRFRGGSLIEGGGRPIMDVCLMVQAPRRVRTGSVAVLSMKLGLRRSLRLGR